MQKRRHLNYHMEDVHRAGGVIAILGELDRAGLVYREVRTVHSETLGEALDQWDIAGQPPEMTPGGAIPLGQLAFLPRKPSARIPAGRVWIWIDKAAVSVTKLMPTHRTVDWRCCTAIWPRMAVSSKPPKGGCQQPGFQWTGAGG